MESFKDFVSEDNESIEIKKDELLDELPVEQFENKVVNIEPEPITEVVEEKKFDNIHKSVGGYDWSDNKEVSKTSKNKDARDNLEREYKKLGEEEFLKSGIKEDSLSPNELRKKIIDMGMNVFYKREIEEEKQRRYKEKQRLDEEEREDQKRREKIEIQKMLDDYDNKHKVAAFLSKVTDFFDEALRFDLLGFFKKKK